MQIGFQFYFLTGFLIIRFYPSKCKRKEKYKEERGEEELIGEIPNIVQRRKKMHVIKSIEKCFAKSIQKFDVSKFCIPPSPTAVL